MQTDIDDIVFFAGIQYSRVIVKALEDPFDLFTLKHLKAMCQLDSHLRSVPNFSEVCAQPLGSHQCCSSWTLPNYVAFLSGQESCANVTEDNVEFVLKLLNSCSKFYTNGNLHKDCYEMGCENVPWKCNAAFEVLHYLVDEEFLANTSLTSAMIFLPIAQGSTLQNYDMSIPNDVASEAAEFGLKTEILLDYLKSDGLLLGLASASVLVLVWIYTHSLFVTATMTVGMALSLITSYFIYTMILEFRFFPFVNLLAVVLVILSGTNSIFLYSKIWMCAKREKNNGVLEKLVADALKNATLSAFVNSITIAAALYGGYVSKITALKCFSVFAGTAILINLLFTVTWLPACVVIHEKWFGTSCCYYVANKCPPKQSLSYIITRLLQPFCKVFCLMNPLSRHVFEKVLPWLVLKLFWLWLFIVAAATVGSFIIIFHLPKLQLQDVNYFQFFSEQSTYKQYDVIYRNRFGFEKLQSSSDHHNLVVNIVWGVSTEDIGDTTDPFSKGVMQLDPSFNVAVAQSQEWLLNFCSQLRNQTFVKVVDGEDKIDCFLERYVKWMSNRPCVSHNSSNSNSPCCNTTSFPYQENIFDHCLTEHMNSQDSSDMDIKKNLLVGSALPVNTDTKPGQIHAMIVQFTTKYLFTFAYSPMDNFYNEIEQWFNAELTTAPAGMKNGWFVSDLAFYDLQKSLSEGTFISVAVSLLCACIVLFVTTLNLLLTLYSIINITAIIFSTIGALVMLGWKLHIFEASLFVLVIGLAVEFTIHYGMAYRFSPDVNRELGIMFSLSRVGSPIAMSVFATSLFGIFMFPASIVVYQKLSIFLIVLMAINWVYSTFFYESILRIMGPEGGYGQFYWPHLSCCESCAPHRVDKTKYCTGTFSESTLSGSSAGNGSHPSSETHELEPLTSAKVRSHFNHRRQYRYQHSYTPHRYRSTPQRCRPSGEASQNNRESTSSTPHTSCTFLYVDDEPEIQSCVCQQNGVTPSEKEISDDIFSRGDEQET